DIISECLGGFVGIRMVSGPRGGEASGRACQACAATGVTKSKPLANRNGFENYRQLTLSDGGMPMNFSLVSAYFSKGRRPTEPSNEPLLHHTARNLITRAWSWLGKVVSFAFARVLMIFFIGFAAGLAWQSYGDAARKAIASWSPHLAWVAP